MQRIALLSALLAACAVACAQDAPPKLVRIVVPFSAGASNDAIARVVAVPLAKRLETTVIVENRPGAAGVIGADAVAKAPRDGATILLTSSTFLTVAATQARLPYDPIASFAPIAVVGTNPSIVAVPATAPFKGIADVIAAARARPDELAYGTAGVGSIGHLVTELLMSEAKLQMRHVPYKGAANAALDLAGGQIQLMVSSYGTLASLLKAGRVRAIAVTSKQPYPAFPDLVPLAATMPAVWNETWVGMFAPAGTPERSIERINREVNEIAASQEMRTLLENDGMMAASMTPAAFAARIRQDLAQWRHIATSRRITVE